MKRILVTYFNILTLIILISISCRKTEGPSRFPLAQQHNIDESQLIAAYNDFIKVEGALSLVVCRDGVIIAEEFTNYEGYGADSIKNIMSVTKTFTGVLIGLAIEKGFIESVNDPLVKYLDGIVTFSENTKENITIDQCLKMTFGHAWNGTSSSSMFEECFFESVDNLQFIIDLPLVSTPGTVFNYSDGASHLLSVIITETTGMSTLDFAKENLFNPLGITDLEWGTDDRNYNLGAAYLRIKPHDMVKFGNMIMNKGRYDGKQVVTESWINEMITSKISTNNDVPYGTEYGYQIWLGNTNGKKYYMAMGWGGQFIIIIPDFDTVITATCWTSGLTDQEAGEHWMKIITLIMEKILPAINS